jgi:uncharacterized protein YbjT (DUF2867 family)
VKTAVVAGATGLVGGHLLRLLLAEPAYERVTVLVRRGLPVRHHKLVQREIDFNLLAELGTVPRVHDVFCCLGTTIKKAGSRQAFSRVDFEYVRDLARAARSQGAAQFLLVSALSANPRSRVFYSRVKGEAEEAVKALGFPGVHVFQPSLLLGERAEFRAGERVAAVVGRLARPLLVGPLRPYRPIPAAAVARAMILVALENARGVHVYRSDHIARLGAA